MLPKLLVLKAGSTHPDVVRSDGDYDAWFVLSLEDGAARCTTVSPFAGEALPDARGFGGVVVTGSPASVRDEAPWMKDVARYCLAAAEAGVPVLGVCFGHQLLGEALGGRVERNPAGPERGTVDVELTDEGVLDPLFEGLPRTLVVQATHQDVLVRPPTADGVVRLAVNTNTAWQAFAYRRIRAVQFHPELSGETLGKLLRARAQEGAIRPSAHGEEVLRRWDRAFVRGGRP